MNKSALKSIYAICLLIAVQTNRINGLFELNNNDLEPIYEPRSNHRNIAFTNQQLTSAVEHAEESCERLKRLEDAISRSRIKLRNDSLSYAQLLESLPNDQAKEYDHIAQIVLKASVQLLNANCLERDVSSVRCAKEIAKYSLPPGQLLDKCKAVQQHSHRKGIHIYRRLLPAHYNDGLYKMPQIQHAVLAKAISDSLYSSATKDLADSGRTTKISGEGILDLSRNVALVQWAQFMEHDLVKTVVQTMNNNKPIECCSEDFSGAPPRYIHPACAPLKVENSNTHVDCLSYVRSALGINGECKFGPAEQLNQATNALDLSQLYGITDDVTNTLRTFERGQLKSSDHDDNSDHECLPIASDDDPHNCVHRTTTNICYRSGDSRVNLSPYVTTMYTIFMRSHNRIARALSTENPGWKDEKIFRQARRINAAIYNKIIFEEWAPVLLGDKVAGHINGEDFLNVNRNGEVSNEFATAGIRFYYSMMPGDLEVERNVFYGSTTNSISRNESATETLELKTVFYRPRNLATSDELERIMRAILNQSAMAMDSGYVDDVAKYMFQSVQKDHKEPVGTDVLALDIIRGRDHGLAKYIRYVEACGERSVRSWDDLRDYIEDKHLDRLKAIYSNFTKIDLIVGAIAEKPVNDATIGPTLSCIIGEQLSNTRRTATHFYSRDKEAKLARIVKEYSGARLLCDFTKLEAVPRNIFYRPSAANPLVNCLEFKTLPRLVV